LTARSVLLLFRRPVQLKHSAVFISPLQSTLYFFNLVVSVLLFYIPARCHYHHTRLHYLRTNTLQNDLGAVIGDNIMVFFALLIVCP